MSGNPAQSKESTIVTEAMAQSTVTWEQVYQAFVDDRANVSTKQLEWVRLKLRKYALAQGGRHPAAAGKT